jgi:hypothetical protein
VALADPVDALVETLLVAGDSNFDAQQIDGHVQSPDLGETDRVFLGGQNHVDLAFDATIDEGIDLLLGESVVIHEALGGDQAPCLRTPSSKLSGTAMTPKLIEEVEEGAHFRALLLMELGIDEARVIADLTQTHQCLENDE